MGKKTFVGIGKKNVFPKPGQEPDRFDLGAVEKELKPLLIGIVERAFRRFMNAHGAPKDVVEIEWARFSKILKGML